MIDNTCGFERMSFMDVFSGYNQIKMYPDDEKHTSFRTPLWVYCYTVMPFGLKNTGGNILESYECNCLRAYTQNSRMLRRQYCSEKSCQRRSHSRSEDSIRYHAGASIEDEPHQILPGITSGKFLRFVFTSKGIHLDLEKVRAVQEMQPSRNLRELRGLQGRLAYIRRFVSNLSGRCQSFTKLMKKGVSFIWDDACQQAFEEIKRYLTHSPVLIASVSGKPFLIYV